MGLQHPDHQFKSGWRLKKDSFQDESYLFLHKDIFNFYVRFFIDNIDFFEVLL